MTHKSSSKNEYFFQEKAEISTFPMFLQNDQTSKLYLRKSSILLHKVFGDRLAKNRRIFRYTKACP